MDPKAWSQPVRIDAGCRTITNTEEAVLYLLSKWPERGGPQHLRARDICLDVLKGHKPADEARQAFLAAAEEAGLYVMA